jgi:hypothetical protein
MVWKEFVLKRAWKAVLAGLFVAAIAMPASADSLGPQGFEAPRFTAGTPLVGADGWTYTGGTNYDVGITAATDGIDGQSLRISNGTMSGSFGDWVFSPHLGTPATENGLKEFTTQFQIKSVTGENQGMSMNIAPQSLDGARMTNLRFEDQADGIHVIFSDALNLDETLTFQDAPFRLADIATLSYGGTHNVEIVMNLFPGPHNDVVQVYIDGSAGLVPGQPAGEATFDGFFAPVDNQPTTNKAKAGQTIPLKWRLATQSFATSWEDYYRYDKESNGGSAVADPIDPVNGYGTRDVDSLIIQARCAGGCTNAPAQGAGYLIDNVTFGSAALGTPLPVASEGVSDPSVYNNPPIKVTGEDCDDLPGALDPIEVYASNANGLMYHGNGVWQYNWQTPKSLAGKCVEVALAPASLDGSTLFKFTK